MEALKFTRMSIAIPAGREILVGICDSCFWKCYATVPELLEVAEFAHRTRSACPDSMPEYAVPARLKQEPYFTERAA